MAIDIQTERLIGLDEAAKLFPGRDGGSVHKFTVGLDARRGKLGVRLETVLAGPRRCTSIEASPGSSRRSRPPATRSLRIRTGGLSPTGRSERPRERSGKRSRSWPRGPDPWGLPPIPVVTTVPYRAPRLPGYSRTACVDAQAG